MRRFSRRLQPRKDGMGGCVVKLPKIERELLASLPSQIDEVLAVADSGSPGEVLPESFRRLFPPAYTRDEEAERHYVSLSRDSLLEHHREALQTLARTADADVLDEEEANGWMAALNDLRLVLGTALDITEDYVPPAADIPYQVQLYFYLGQLQLELIEVLTGYLPEPLPGADDEVPDDPWGEPLGGLRWDGTPQPDEPFGHRND